jgi:hypothetical protein
MTDHFLAAAKAYCALIGAVLTAITANVSDVPSWVPVVTAVVTAVATYTVPNRPRKGPPA